MAVLARVSRLSSRLTPPRRAGVWPLAAQSLAASLPDQRVGEGAPRSRSRVVSMHVESSIACAAARGSILAVVVVSLDWPRLYAAHAPDLRRCLAGLADDPEVGADLMQECFVRGLRSEGLIRDHRPVQAWLFRTATNLARNERRRRALLRFVPLTGLERSADDGFDPDAAQLRAALRTLPFEQATALLLRYESGFHRGEIAAARHQRRDSDVSAQSWTKELRLRVPPARSWTRPMSDGQDGELDREMAEEEETRARLTQATPPVRLPSYASIPQRRPRS